MKTKTITGTAVLGALTIVLTLISNYIQIGAVSINLAIIPIAIASIIYGPFSGLIVGLINGALVLVAPSSLSIFFTCSPLGTILICLLKTGLAGLVSGYIYKLFKKHQLVGSIVSSISVAFINTSIFILGSLIFFMPIYENFVNIIISVLTINFLIEVAVITILSPATVRVLNIAQIHNN